MEDLVLNNGTIAKHCGADDLCRDLYQLKYLGKIFTAVDTNDDRVLYSRDDVSGEPIAPPKHDLQPVKEENVG